MSGVQQVEASIGEGDSPATQSLTINGVDQLRERHYFSLKHVVFAGERSLENLARDYFRTVKRYLDTCRGIGEEGSRKQGLARRGKETKYGKNHVASSSHVIHITGTRRNMMSLTIALQQVHTIPIECYQARFEIQFFHQLIRRCVPACF